MTFTERGNYFIAILLSLIFHLLLLMIYIPQYLKSLPSSLETYPVGIVEVAAGSVNPSELTNGNLAMVSENAAGPNTDTTSNSNKNPAEKLNQGKTALTPAEVKPKPVNEGFFPIPKKEGLTDQTKPSKGLTQGTPPGEDGNNGSNGTGTGKPVSFGTGEGMVTVLGPLPPYPKNAMNEGKEGEVAVRVMVRANGGLDEVSLIKSSGDARLDKVTISAIERNWQFKAVTKNYYIDLIFSFTIKAGVTIKFINSESRP